MKFNLYTVYDELAEEAGPIFCAKNDSVAQRQYDALMVQVLESEKSKYHLYYIGEYDSETMLVDGECPLKMEGKVVEADFGRN